MQKGMPLAESNESRNSGGNTGMKSCRWWKRECALPGKKKGRESDAR